MSGKKEQDNSRYEGPDRMDRPTHHESVPPPSAVEKRWGGLVKEMGRLMLQVPRSQRADLIRMGGELAAKYEHNEALVDLYSAMFDEQVATIKRLGLHTMCDVSEQDVDVMFERLRPGLAAIGMCKPERIPFLIVIPAGLLPPAETLVRTSLNEENEKGIELQRINWRPISPRLIPDDIYLLIDVEIGLATRSMSGNGAMTQMITPRKRVPLTLAEFAALARTDRKALERLSMNIMGEVVESLNAPVWDRANAPLWDRKAGTVRKVAMIEAYDNTGTPSAARRWVQEYKL